MKLPENIEGLIQAQNDQNSTTFATYFSKDALVSDEGSSYTGREQIKAWIQQATDKYNMQIKPVDFVQTGSSAKLTVEVTGTFNGSPAMMDYHFGLDGDLISALRITG